jgi:hypothetical protein
MKGQGGSWDLFQYLTFYLSVGRLLLTEWSRGENTLLQADRRL